ncbi:DJ-1/PfpI family protein [Methylocystis iwaonis]|uniref:DJ-1/PfpI family protein n=1 Tax=Methylocystis iwaonis TaxID=2885079 RepID=UPI002E7B9F3F|nr:DJ-1/PfpI family protein [Methylocystis iwaonis]
MSPRPFTIVFALYDGMTQLDFTGPHEFLSRTPGAVTLVASREGGSVKSDRLEFGGTVPLATVSDCDLLCVPGGLSATAVALDRVFIAEIRRLGLGARYVTSVCTGSLILGAAGLLKGKRAACHWAWRDLLPLFGAIPQADRVVRDGDIITGGGVTAGMDFALTVLAEITGADVAQAIQLGLEYDPEPPFHAGSPQSAPPQVLARFQATAAPLIEKRRAQAEEAARLLVGDESTIGAISV